MQTSKDLYVAVEDYRDFDKRCDINGQLTQIQS